MCRDKNGVEDDKEVRIILIQTIDPAILTK